MAESALIYLLFKLASLSNQELKLLEEKDGDIECIKSEVIRTLEFLNYGETHCFPTYWEPSTDSIKKVRDAAYKLEDALDKDSRLVFKRRNSGRRNIAMYKNLICNLVKPLIARRKLSAKTIRSFETRLRTILPRNVYFRTPFRGPKISNISNLASEGDSNDKENGVFHVKPDLEIMKRPKADLITSLMSDEKELKVIFVTGEGGLGKSTLVRAVFEDADIMKNFHYRAWITFSSSKTFKSNDKLRDLIHQLLKIRAKQRVDSEVETMTGIALNQKVREILQGKRFLIVLDDVRSVKAWNSIKDIFPNNNCRSRVMLSTRIEKLGITSCKPRDHVYKLRPLSLDESWNLLCRKISADPTPYQLMDTFKSILEKCNGLPLAIAAFCGVVNSEDMVKWQTWNIDTIDASFSTIAKILLFSYENLPYHLKLCFLYMIIFPEDHLIECRRLIRLWMAEGFVEPNQGNEEQVAEGYLTELLKRNLVQVAETRSDGRIKSCRIHELFRYLLIDKSQEENFASIVIGGEDHHQVKQVRRLSVHDNLKDDIPIQNLPKLRTLVIFEVEKPSSSLSFPYYNPPNLKLLTVLDLQGAKLAKIFPKWIARLFNLRFLSLRDTNVEEIPSSVGKLHKLQTLDLKHTGVWKLPAEICNLEHLSNLLIYHYKFEKDTSCLRPDPSQTQSTCGFEIPQGIECMRSLQKLGFVDAAKSGVSKVKKIGYLTELRRLGIVNLREETSAALCHSIKKLQNLQSLSLTSAEGEILELYSLSTPPKRLQRLYLTGKLTSLSKLAWLPQLQNLVKIFLKWSETIEDPLQTLEQLPNLLHIELCRAYTGKEMHFRHNKFSKLRILGLHEMECLERVIVEKESMQDLKRLVIGNCKSLKKVPQGIQHLKNLRVLDFINMPSELYRSISRPEKQGKDYSKVYRVPVKNPNYVLNDLWKQERKIATEGLAKLVAEDSPEKWDGLNSKITI